MWNVAQVFQSLESFGGLQVPSEDFVLSGLRGVSALTGRQFLAGEEPAPWICFAQLEHAIKSQSTYGPRLVPSVTIL